MCRLKTVLSIRSVEMIVTTPDLRKWFSFKWQAPDGSLQETNPTNSWLITILLFFISHSLVVFFFVLNNEKVSRFLFLVFPYSDHLSYDPRVSLCGSISLLILPNVTLQDYHRYTKRETRILHFMGHFSLISYLLFLKYWELTLVVSFISPEVGFYITGMCTEVVTLGSLYGQWRERGTSAVWFISVQRKMNPACKCLFLPTSQWGTLGLLIQHSSLAGVTPAARHLKA